MNSSRSSTPAPTLDIDVLQEESSVSIINDENDDAGWFTHGKTLRSSVWKYATKVTSNVAQCNICSKMIKTSSGGTTTLRKHLSRQHQIKDLTFHSQTTQKIINNSISKNRKGRLDQLVKVAIFEDGHSFGDLRKSGMMKFLAEAIPGKKK